MTEAMTSNPSASHMIFSIMFATDSHQMIYTFLWN